MQVAIRASKYTWVVGHMYLRETGGVVELAKVNLQLEMVDIILKDVGVVLVEQYMLAPFSNDFAKTNIVHQILVMGLWTIV